MARIRPEPVDTSRLREPAPIDPQGRVAGMVLQYLHVDGCGMPAFLMRRKPQLREAIRSIIATHLDGTVIQPGTPITCDCCGQPIRLNLENVVPIRPRVWAERWERWRANPDNPRPPRPARPSGGRP